MILIAFLFSAKMKVRLFYSGFSSGTKYSEIAVHIYIGIYIFILLLKKNALPSSRGAKLGPHLFNFVPT